ncbi:MAG: aspartate aminotransferase family protein [Candidatus Sericytochromatia bacterium]
MDLPAPKAWFLGPKAENQEFFERMLLEAFRDYCYWRRNFHPEDQAYVRAADRLRPEFLEYQENLHDRLFEMLSQLKRSMPFFSPRYLGHMAKDLLTPGMLGYIAAMFYNQNNITREAATITTGFEAEAMRGIARMLGYAPDRAWGHLCSGGTLANIEALWVARNLALFPHQVALARAEAPAPLLARLNRLLTAAELEPGAPISCNAGLRLNGLLQAACRQDAELGQLLNAFSPSQLGLAGFYRTCRRARVALPERLRIAYSQNAHYSLRKSLGLLGLGEDAALLLPLDRELRMDVSALEAALAALPADESLLAVVGVYGSTEEGAIDDFSRLATLRAEAENAGRGFWLHGDACYGGYALSLLDRDANLDETEAAASLQAYLESRAVAGQNGQPAAWEPGRCRRWLQVSMALGQCDSIALDPHKLGYLPYPAGSVLYRDYRMREFIRCDAPYINSQSKDMISELNSRHDDGLDSITGLETDGDYWNTPYPGHYTLEGSRPGATSAAIWLAHQTVPLDRSGHGLLVAGTLLGAHFLQQVLEQTIARLLPGIACRFLCETPDLNLLCYTFSGSWQGRPLSLWQANRAVEAVYQALLAREEQPRQTQDFIVSMTRLEAGSYGEDALNTYWQRLAPGSDARVTVSGRPGIDDNHIALLRTVVMDPFLTEAMIRPSQPAPPESLAESFARTLAQQIEKIVNS